MKAFTQFLRVLVSLSILLFGTAKLQGLTPQRCLFMCRTRSNHVSCLKTEHDVGPLRGTDEPYNSVTKSMARQVGRSVTPSKQSLQDAVDIERHGAKSVESRHQKDVVMIDRDSEARLKPLTPVSTRSVYSLISSLARFWYRHLSSFS